MTRRTKLLIAALVGICVVAGTTAYAQGDAAAQLRASGHVGLVDTASGDVRAQMEQVNIQRRAAYTQLAAQRNATIEEVAAATACQLFAGRVGPDQYYRLPDGVWRRRNGSEPVPRPSHCG